MHKNKFTLMGIYIWSFLLMTDSKNNKTIIGLIFLVLACCVFLKHINLTYISDDAWWIENFSNQSLKAIFIDRINNTGRFIADVLANIFYRQPESIWKIANSLVFTGIAFCMYRLTKRTWFDAAIISILIYVFPLNYLESAGYVASSTNYIYPALAVLVVCLFVKLSLSGKIPLWLQIIPTLSIIYATNQDQYALVLILGLILVVAYLKRKTPVSVWVYLGLSAISYIVMFFTPGHIARMNNSVEMLVWFPEYADWTFADKALHGYTSTMANLLFGRLLVFDLLVILIMFLGLLNRRIWIKITGLIPAAIMFVLRIIGSDSFLRYDRLTLDFLDLGQGYSATGFVLSIIMLIGIVVTVVFSLDSSVRYIFLSVLSLAAISREMLGFSATLYASSYRTFIWMIFSFMICDYIIIRHLTDSYGKS